MMPKTCARDCQMHIIRLEKMKVIISGPNRPTKPLLQQTNMNASCLRACFGIGAQVVQLKSTNLYFNKGLQSISPVLDFKL
jgi:hypothetical protein